MLRLNIRVVLLFKVTLLFLSCTNSTSKLDVEQRRVNIKYKNGTVFCDGINSISKKDGLPKNRVGVWNFYSPNGKLEALLEYNQHGELISEKSYSENGILKYSDVVTDNITTTFYYYDNGKIKTESISKVETESNGDDDTEMTYETIKEYSLNGHLYSISHLENGLAQGSKKIWDTSGNLALTVEYNKGLIISK